MNMTANSAQFTGTAVASDDLGLVHATRNGDVLSEHLRKHTEYGDQPRDAQLSSGTPLQQAWDSGA
jgi:hypothetical protein